MKNLLILGALTFIAVSSAFADDFSDALPKAYTDTRERVVTITTDAFPGTFAIDLVRNTSGAVTQMYYQTPDNPNGLLTLSQLQGGPQVIFVRRGHDAILLSLESDFNAQKGGHMIVRYLYNGMDDTYKDFRVLVSVEKTIVLHSDPNPADPDSDGNAYTGAFNQLFMPENTGPFGITIGIDHVVPSYH